MEQGSPETPPSSSLEQRRIAEDVEFQPSSYLALLMGLQNIEAQQIEASFLRVPVPFGNSDLNTQQAYSTPNAMILETPVPLRSTGTQGIRYSTHVPGGINVASGGSNYALGSGVSRLKRKMIEDDIAPNPISWASFLRGDQGYSSSYLGAFAQGYYTLYDRRYQEIGLPVDPHLRIFNAVNGNGSGGSTSKNK